MNRESIVLLHAVISPYKVVLFNNLCQSYPNFHVIYYATTENMRAWTVDLSDLKHHHTLLNDGALENHSWIKISMQLWKALNRIDPDLLIISEYIYLPYWIGLLWAIVNRKKRIFFSESTAADRSRSWPKEFIKRLFVKRFHAGIAQGSQSKAYINALGLPVDKITVKGYSTNNDFYEAGAAKARLLRPELLQKWGLSSHNILYVGRFAPEKNIPILINAFSSVSNRFPEWGLLLVGGGPLHSQLERLVVENGLRSVKIIPFIQKEQLPEIYGLADIFVLPSISEPWGLVVNEAMATGLPVIVSNRAGSAHDLVNTNTGFTFDPTDSDTLCDALAQLMENEELRRTMGANGKQLISEYTSEKSALRMANAITQCLDA